MKRSTLVLVVGALALATSMATPAAAQIIRHFKCGRLGALAVCVVPSFPCNCRAANQPVFNSAGVQIGTVSWCRQGGPCP